MKCCHKILVFSLICWCRSNKPRADVYKICFLFLAETSYFTTPWHCFFFMVYHCKITCVEMTF